MALQYDYVEHRHRFAAWAASRAASVKGFRFEVREGKQALEDSGLRDIVSKADLPEPKSFDECHLKWREALIIAWPNSPKPSHGIAAKLINCYLKCAVVLGAGEDAASDPRIICIHPPIDRLLLEAVKRGFPEVKRLFPNPTWSKFTSEEYQETINILRNLDPA